MGEDGEVDVVVGREGAMDLDGRGSWAWMGMEYRKWGIGMDREDVEDVWIDDTYMDEMNYIHYKRINCLYHNLMFSLDATD